MYEEFYGLREKPFMLTPDADLFYPSDEHRKALNMLEYGLQGHATFVAITGEVGTGKTTLIRRFINSLDDSSTVGVITNTHASFGELLQWVLLAFELEYKDRDKVELYEIFVDFLIQEYSANRQVMLVIDEAQNMSMETLEELRMLSNVNLRKDLVLQIILVGQPELLGLLKRPELRQFAQRISASYDLAPLNCHETIAYIRHRVTTVGGGQGLFDDLAGVAVHYFTQGIPRLINMLCDQALVYGFAEERETIDLKTVVAVVEDKQKAGLGFLPKEMENFGIAELYKNVSEILAQSEPVDSADPVDMADLDIPTPVGGK